MVDVARRVGIQRRVVLSAMGTSASSPVEFLRWHAEIDDHIAASGIEYTILRVAGFMQAHLLPVATVTRHWRGGGSGWHTPIPATPTGSTATGPTPSVGCARRPR